MTLSKVRKIGFSEYLDYDDGTGNRYALIDGALVALPPESELNDAVAQEVFWLLALDRVVPRRLLRPGKCEVQVPILDPQDPANRFPDFVILDEAHLELAKTRLTITLDMPPPRIVMEVVSLGKRNRDRDYIRKRAQYAATGIPEFWLIDPTAQQLVVLALRQGEYVESGVFRGDMAIVSPELGTLKVTAARILSPEST
jgi:Uma2 family endonuclease